MGLLPGFLGTAELMMTTLREKAGSNPQAQPLSPVQGLSRVRAKKGEMVVQCPAPGCPVSPQVGCDTHMRTS